MEQNQQSTSRRDHRYRRKNRVNGSYPVILCASLPCIQQHFIFLSHHKAQAQCCGGGHQRLPFHQRCPDRKSFFPTKSVSMTLDGEPLELEKGRHLHTRHRLQERSVETSVVNLNGMPATVFEHVNVLDDNPPEFSSTDIQDGVVTITVADSQSGINFDSIYALNLQVSVWSR